MISRITSLRRVPKISRTKMSAMVSAITRAGISRTCVVSMAPTIGRQRRAHELLEQALLVAEVEIDRALGDAGAAGDVVEAGRGKAGGGEFFERGGEDRVAPVGLSGRPRLAAGRGFSAALPPGHSPPALLQWASPSSMTDRSVIYTPGGGLAQGACDHGFVQRPASAWRARVTARPRSVGGGTPPLRVSISAGEHPVKRRRQYSRVTAGS